MAQSMIKKLSDIKPKSDLQYILPRFIHYQIGIKAYYELLAVTFVKHVDSIDFKNKCNIMYWLALADIDVSAISKTAEKLCSAYSEALSLR
jgi:hypothetical protein